MACAAACFLTNGLPVRRQECLSIAEAGDAGRGFAVVADEVRKLAESTQKSLDEINRTMLAIISGITETSERMHQQAEVVKGLADSSQGLGQTIGESATLIAASAQMADNMNQISGTVQGQIDEVAGGVGRFDALSRLNAGSLEEVAGISQELRQAAGQTRQLLSQFRT